MKKSGLTGFGYFIVAACAIALIVIGFYKNQGTPFYEVILGSLFMMLMAILGTGILFVAVFVVMYCAIQASELIFKESEDDNSMKGFMSVLNPVLIVCFVISYAAVILYMLGAFH